MPGSPSYQEMGPFMLTTPLRGNEEPTYLKTLERRQLQCEGCRTCPPPHDLLWQDPRQTGQSLATPLGLGPQDPASPHELSLSCLDREEPARYATRVGWVTQWETRGDQLQMRTVIWSSPSRERNKI